MRVGGKWGGGGHFIEAGRSSTFSASRMSAYSRWALIGDWALIRINTVTSSYLNSQVELTLLGR